MDAEIKSRWIALLRSGTYEQTGHRLATDHGYCCLGVLCEVAVQDQIVIKTPADMGTIPDAYEYTSKVKAEDVESSVLPWAVSAWARVEGTNPALEVEVQYFPELKDWAGDSPTFHISLAELNDNYGFSFDRIADVVERYL